MIETGLWIALAVLAFVFSQSFAQNIEIYRFNATGWPRAIIVLILIAIAANLYQTWRHGSESRVMLGNDGEEETQPLTPLSIARIGTMLLLPIVYAFLLPTVGFYILTPLFIFALLLLMGERRPVTLALVTFGIYGLLVFFFGKLLYLNLPVGTWQPAYDFSNWFLTVIR